MIEDKIKQEYEWQHSEIGQPTLDELFSKINEALGIELWIWQKTYMTMGTYRQMGATTAQCLRVLLFSETTPLDYSSPPTIKMGSGLQQSIWKVKSTTLRKSWHTLTITAILSIRLRITQIKNAVLSGRRQRGRSAL